MHAPNTTDKDYMKLAIREVKKPNEFVGCGVVIKDNKIISKAYNTQRDSFDATAHAEINATRKACKMLKS